MGMAMEREAFLARVRAATGGTVPAATPTAKARRASPRESAEPDALDEMANWWRRPHRGWYRVATSGAGATVAGILRAGGLRRAAISDHPLLNALGVPAAAATAAEILPLSGGRALVHTTLASADVGITAAVYAVAETGTLVERAGPDQPRGISLLPPVHIAVVRAADVLASLDDLFAILAREPMGSGIVLIAGPSGTADIGLQHVTGAHGPREVHVVVVDEEPQWA